MASQDFNPILMMLPDRSVRLFDCLPGSTLTVDDVLRDYPGHSLGKFQDARKPILDLSSPLIPGATYYLTARRHCPLPPLAQLDADVTSPSIPSTPSSCCSSRTENPWAMFSPTSSASGHVATPHASRAVFGIHKSASLKSEDDEDCSWNSHPVALRFSMSFPPRPIKNSKHSATTPRVPRPPVPPSPKSNSNSILKELQDLEEAERCSVTPRNPVLAELEETESDCMYMFSRTSTTGRRGTAAPAPNAGISRSRQSVCIESDAMKLEIAAAKAMIKHMAAGSDISTGSKMDKKKQRLKPSAVLGKLGGLSSLVRRKFASAPMESLGEHSSSNNLPTCMDLESLCQSEETEAEWDWNPRAEMFYSMKM